MFCLFLFKCESEKNDLIGNYSLENTVLIVTFLFFELLFAVICLDHSETIAVSLINLIVYIFNCRIDGQKTVLYKLFCRLNYKSNIDIRVASNHA